MCLHKYTIPFNNLSNGIPVFYSSAFFLTIHLAKAFIISSLSSLTFFSPYFPICFSVNFRNNLWVLDRIFSWTLSKVSVTKGTKFIHNKSCNCSHERNNNRISHLFVCLNITTRKFERVWIPLKSSTSPKCKPSWNSSFASINDDFRTILVISSAKGSRYAIKRRFVITKAIAFCTMFCGVVLKILPQMFCQNVLVVILLLKDITETIWFGHEKDYKSPTELIDVIDDYVRWYNEERIQHESKGLTPLQFRAQTFKLATQ